MLKDMSASLMVLCLLFSLASPGAVARTQPSFSADLVTTHVGKPNGRLGHVYASGGQVRIEAPEFTDGFFIVDGDRSAAWFVRPRQRLFMDAKQSSPLTQLLVLVDPNDPCRQWQVMENIAGATDAGGEWHCDLLGLDVVDGRETMKYLAISRQGHPSYRWIDPQRAFPVRLETEDGARVAVENIVDAPQPSSLFTIPPDYHKFDPAQLIELVKRSDVWVESPR
jgi:hypothetical protein